MQVCLTGYWHFYSSVFDHILVSFTEKIYRTFPVIEILDLRCVHLAILRTLSWCLPFLSCFLASKILPCPEEGLCWIETFVSSSLPSVEVVLTSLEISLFISALPTNFKVSATSKSHSSGSRRRCHKGFLLLRKTKDHRGCFRLMVVKTGGRYRCEIWWRVQARLYGWILRKQFFGNIQLA